MVTSPPLATLIPFRWLLKLERHPVRASFGSSRRHLSREHAIGTPILQRALLYARLATLSTAPHAAELQTEDDIIDEGVAHAR